MISKEIANLIYLIAAGLFIFDLKWMSHPRTAVRGNYAGMLGMLLATPADLEARAERLAKTLATRSRPP